MVVGGGYSVALFVSELQLNVHRLESTLVEDSRGQAAESVTSHASLVSHALERHEDGAIAHRPVLMPLTGEEKFPSARHYFKSLQNLDGLSRQRDDVG